MTRTSAKSERGAAAVEMAIVFPVLILLLFGIIDFGRIFNGEIQISQAAREGARLASLQPAYTDIQVIDRAVAAAGNPAFTSTPAEAQITRACPGSPAPTDTAEVTVTFKFQGILYPTSEKTYTQSATMRCGG